MKKSRLALVTLLMLALLAGLTPMGGALGEAEEAPTLTMFINSTGALIDNWGKDIVSQKIMEGAGVNLVLEKPSSDDNQKLNLMLASGSGVPDLSFYGKSNSAFQDMIEAGMLYSLDELIESYAPEFKETAYYQANWDNISYTDGNVYYIPSWSSPKEFEDSGVYIFGRNGYYMRGDIYEAVGSPELNTLDDLTETLKLVQEAYPETKSLQLWNAVNEPMDNTSGVIMFYYSMGGEYNYYWKDENTLSPYFTSETYKDALMYLRELNELGMINENDFTRDYAQMEIEGNNGSFFMGVGCLYECLDANGAVGGNVEGAYYTPANVLSKEEGQEVLVPAALRAGGDGICVTRNCQDPEAAFRLIEYLVSEEGQTLALAGVEGERWDWIEEGKSLAPIGEWAELCNSDWTGWTEELGTYKYTWGVGDFYDCCLAWGLANADEARLNVYNMESQTRDSSAFEDILPLGGSDEEVAWTKIKAQWQRYVPKLITAANLDEFEQVWTEYIDTLNSQGMEQIEAYVTQRYNEKNA